MKKVIILTYLVVLGSFANAQQDPQFTMFMFDRVSYNPAAAGIDGVLNITAFYRNQWNGFEGAPSTGLINASSPIFSINSGVGLSLYFDEIGQTSTINGLLSYNYQLKVGSGMKLSLGLAVGMYNSKVGTNWIATDGVDNDSAIPITGESSTAFDASFGVVLRSEQLYVGLSATHLTGGDLTNVNVVLTQHFYFEAGYDFILGDAFKLTPNVLVKTDFVSTQFDINLTAMWNNIVWLGVSYRFEDAVAPMVGLQFPVGKSGEIRIGYSYDVTISELKNYSSGTNEIFINYNMSLGKPLDKTKYKNVRFL
jgi:type IX secretion system PorP/SprF family membrane protein